MAVQWILRLGGATALAGLLLTGPADAQTTLREALLAAWAPLVDDQSQLAAEMGLREITVKIHRGNIMRKMKAGSLPDLVRMADALGLRRPET